MQLGRINGDETVEVTPGQRLGHRSPRMFRDKPLLKMWVNANRL